MRKTTLEENWNARSHGIAIPLAILGGVFLLRAGTTNMLGAAVLVYFVSLVVLFTASTLYHSFYEPRLKKKLRIFDHVSIYYLIAGTYTPVCVAILKESKGLLLLCLVWGIALFGTLLKVFFTGRFEVFSLLLYAIMGWLVVIDLPFLIENASSEQLRYLSLGGFFYTVGILFYAIKKIPFNHFIWHLFVLAGAIFHYFLIYSIVYET